MWDIRESTFDTGAITLNYAEVPSPGAPLVLLHGGSARWQWVDSLIAGLADEWHVYAPDLRGHGKSGWAPGSYRLQDYADDIVAFLEGCVQEPAYLFGHSLGGMIALLVAAQYPHGVRAVAVGDAPLSGETWRQIISVLHQEKIRVWRDLAGGQVPLAELVELLKDSPTEAPGRSDPVPLRELVGEDSPVFADLAANLYHNDPDMMTALIERFETTASGYEMERVLPAIRCPVLLLQADPTAGGLMTGAEVAAALPLLARAQHVRLEGVSHVLHNEQLELVLQALTAFFLEKG